MNRRPMARARAASSVSERWLPRAEVERLDVEIATGGRGSGAVRLRVGEVLEALTSQGGHFELGFSSIGALALQACQRAPRWAGDSRALARRLASLPRVRRALLRGELSWSMAETLARTAEERRSTRARGNGSTPTESRDEGSTCGEADTEGSTCGEDGAEGSPRDKSGDDWEQELVEWAKQRTVRQVRKRLGRARATLPQSPPRDPDGWAPLLPRPSHDPRRIWERALAVREEERAADEAEEGHAEAADEREAPDPAASALDSVTHEDRDNLVERMRSLGLTVNTEDYWSLHLSRWMVERIVGHPVDDETFLEALVGEAWDGLRGRVEGANEPVPEEWARDREAKRQLDAQREAWRREAEERCEARISRELPEDVTMPDLDGPLPSDPDALYEMLERLMKQLDAHDLQLGDRARRLFRADGWRRLGYASERQYAMERAGMSLSGLRARMTLSHRTQRFPALRTAVERGDLGVEAALLVERVATEDTIDAWIDRATRRTIKHLREEVHGVELLSRLLGRTGILPPTPEEMAELLQLEGAAKSGRLIPQEPGEDEQQRGASSAREHPGTSDTGNPDSAEPPEADDGSVDGDTKFQMSVAPDVSPDDSSGDEAADMGTETAAELAPANAGMSAGEAPGPDVTGKPGTANNAGTKTDAATNPPPKTTNADRGSKPRRSAARIRARYRVSEDLHDLWRGLEQVYARAGWGGTFVNYACMSLWESWRHALALPRTWQEVEERFGYRCTNPVCLRHDCTCHHLVFRSKGGGHDKENLTVPCGWCHIYGIHGGRIIARPPSSNTEWVLGRKGRIVVRGRELIRS